MKRLLHIVRIHFSADKPNIPASILFFTTPEPKTEAAAYVSRMPYFENTREKLKDVHAFKCVGVWVFDDIRVSCFFHKINYSIIA